VPVRRRHAARSSVAGFVATGARVHIADPDPDALAAMTACAPAIGGSVCDITDFAVNLSGTFDVTRNAIPLLKESPAGSIIVMSSLAGRFGYPNRVAYATTKWGLVGFTKTLALELGPFGITANSIHPGGVEGERVRQVLRRRADVSGRTMEEEYERALDNQSVRRFTEAADIAALAVFLAGPHGRTISGQMLPIDGDAKAAQ
jgi:NAD(P)-dependent dehydrogenase (short-subunit alcohol dehydrogenase family)